MPWKLYTQRDQLAAFAQEMDKSTVGLRLMKVLGIFLQSMQYFQA